MREIICRLDDWLVFDHQVKNPEAELKKTYNRCTSACLLLLNIIQACADDAGRVTRQLAQKQLTDLLPEGWEPVSTFEKSAAWLVKHGYVRIELNKKSVYQFTHGSGDQHGMDPELREMLKD